MLGHCHTVIYPHLLCLSSKLMLGSLPELEGGAAVAMEQIQQLQMLLHLFRLEQKDNQWLLKLMIDVCFICSFSR